MQKKARRQKIRKQRRNTHLKKKYSIKFYIGIIMCIFLIPLLCTNLTIVIRGMLFPNEVPRILGIAPMIIVTDSMNTPRSNIAGGDMVFAKDIDTQKLEVDDIILFKQGRSLVLHRIVEIDNSSEGRSFITKGDANNAEDSTPVPAEAVVGIYIMRIPNIGHFVLFMRTGTGILTCIVIPLALFWVYELFQKSQRTKEMEQEIKKLRSDAKNNENVKKEIKNSKPRKRKPQTMRKSADKLSRN